MKYKHLQLISLLIEFLTSDARSHTDINNYLLDRGIRYPEKAMRELTLEVQERVAFSE